MKNDISALSVVIAGVVYGCAVFMVLMYIAHAMALAMMQARWVVEEIEMVF